MPQSTMISALTPNNNDHTLHVRVGRIWESMNKKKNTLLHTNVILLDEEKNHIVATIRNNQKQIYLPLLKEHRVYSISNFKVVPGPALYRSVDREFAINFFFNTRIEEKPDTGVIPLYKFELQSFDKVKNLVGRLRCLIDVVGKVLSYGHLMKMTNGTEKMDVLLINERNEFMTITLWKVGATHFLDLLATSKDGPVFVVMTGLVAKKFSDSPSLSSTNATRCYVNIDYAPLNTLKYALRTANNETPQPLPPPTAEQFVTSTGEIFRDLSISSVLETIIPTGTQVVRCLCRAKIVAVIDKNGWYYDCCPTCARALGDLDGKFYCLACDEETPSLAQRYRIVVQIEDPSGSTTVTLFDQEAQQLVGFPLPKLLSAQGEENNKTPFPPAINDIIGKVCTFQMNITPYNIIQGCKDYDITGIFEVNDVHSQQHILSDSNHTGNPINATAYKKQKIG
ncbi:hypothetical protein POM88_036539 [Heracleum sosnowskyi]|uniref:Replication factor A C-terminal domain-containing protein n=1 Tax=Heracleum sosnowskyi TaxID=360622 RepID=A0AAD8HND1_9APIA|nr:hypothetical protein POM88_036539 [Heracleum sosnowskyi]